MFIGYDDTSLPPSEIMFIASIPSIVQKLNEAFSNSIEKNNTQAPKIIKNRTKTLYSVQLTSIVKAPYITNIIASVTLPIFAGIKSEHRTCNVTLRGLVSILSNKPFFTCI